MLLRSDLVPSPSDRNYRNKMVYALGPDAPPPSQCTLGLPAVARAGAVVAEWRAMSDWPELYREVTVRVSRRGKIQLKLLLQSEEPLEVAYLEESAAWANERRLLVATILSKLGVESASYQRAKGRARPPKDAPLTALYGAARLLEECPCPGGASYLVGPETLSQVNHATGAALIRRVAEWVGSEPLDNVLVTGRDINCFGFGLVAPRLAAASRMWLVTHCPNAFSDAKANVSRGDAGAAATLLLESKGDHQAARIAALATEEQPPQIAIVTAGRRGVGAPCCDALRRLPLQTLVYVACCERTLADDCVHLLGAGGFYVVGAERYDHFAGCAGEHVGAALLLRRRPPTLLLPIGPAGSGKTMIAAALAASLPPGAAVHIERDALFAAARAESGLAAARRATAEGVDAAVGAAAAAGAQLVVIDSCNASRGGRARYAALMPDRTALLLASFEGAGRELLVERVRRRRAHPTFPEEADAQEAALDATLAAMEWPDAAKEGAVVLRCDSAGGEASLLQVVSVNVFARVLWPCCVPLNDTDTPADEADLSTLTTLPTLPEDLLLCVLSATESGSAVAASARTCRALRAACSCDKLWHRLCLSTWPNVAIARHAPPAHLRVLPPVDSWRHLYRARVAAATPADAWRELLPLYDESTLVATQRHEGWVVEVGILLNRIMRWRERHNLPIAPAREEMVHDGRTSESYCWSQTMQHELTGGIGEIVAVAHEVVGVPEGTILDAGWAWILEAVDALNAINTALQIFLGAPLLGRDGDYDLFRNAADRLCNLMRRLFAQRDVARSAWAEARGFDFTRRPATMGAGPY